MLAYVFWHTPLPGVARAEYEGALRDFHRGLRDCGVSGFLQSQSFRIRGAPWINAAGEAYADWYLVDGSAALDPLNEAAVTGKPATHHARVAAMAAGGAGGLYRQLSGTSDLAGGCVETWLSKPKGMAYPDFYERMRAFTQREAAELWRRQMVLGPTPEFCLVLPSAADLPRELGPLAIPREPV